MPCLEMRLLLWRWDRASCLVCHPDLEYLISVNESESNEFYFESSPKLHDQSLPHSKLGIFLRATGRMYLASVTSDLCPVCSRICQGCRPFSAALVQ